MVVQYKDEATAHGQDALHLLLCTNELLITTLGDCYKVFIWLIRLSPLFTDLPPMTKKLFSVFGKVIRNLSNRNY